MTRIALWTLPAALVACATADLGTPELTFESVDARVQAPIALSLTAGPGAAGAATTFTVGGLAPFESVTLLRGPRTIGEGPCSPQLGNQCIDLAGRAAIVATGTADASGAATLSYTLPPGTRTGAEQGFQAVAIRGAGGADSVASNPVRLRASNGNARLRVLHASPDAPAVDIYANGGLLLANVPFGVQSGWLDVPANTYAVDIRAAGADPASAPVFSQSFDLDAALSYTVVATGFLASGDPADAFRLAPLVDDWGTIDPTAIRVRILHASPDAPAVGLDVGNDGTIEIPVLDRFAETGAAGVALPAGTALAVGVVTTGGAPVTSFSLPALAPGEEAIVIARGALGDHPADDTGFGLQALLRDGSDATILQDPVVYALHASPGAPAVDILAGGATLAGDLAFRELSTPIQVPPGSYALDIAVANSATIVDTFTTPALEAGQRYLVTATGFVGGSPAFQLLVSPDTFDRDDLDGRIQLAHASPDAPAVDIGLVDNGQMDVFLSSVPFGVQTLGRGINTPATSYDVGISLPGDPNPLFTFPGVAIAEGQRAFFLATGSLGLGNFGVTVVDATSSPWATVTVTAP